MFFNVEDKKFTYLNVNIKFMAAVMDVIIKSPQLNKMILANYTITKYIKCFKLLNILGYCLEFYKMLQAWWIF